MRPYLLKFLVLMSPLFLAACGEGWEMVRVTDISPYGNSRTAGSGIAYVRAKLAPPQELKVDNLPQIETMQENVEPAVTEELNAIFDAGQRK